MRLVDVGDSFQDFGSDVQSHVTGDVLVGDAGAIFTFGEIDAGGI